MNSPGHDYPSDARVNALRNLIGLSIASYQRETGDETCWPFMVDAVIYLAEGLSCARPDLARPFLEAIAQRGTDRDIDRINRTTDTILRTRAELVDALRAMRGMAS